MRNLLSNLLLKYFRILTRSYLRRNEIEIVGLTGSAGKSTLTLAIYKVLSQKFKVEKTFKRGHGLNSETGIPLAVLDVHIDGYTIFDWMRYIVQATVNFFIKKVDYEKLIVEMGVDKPGDMEFLLSMLDLNVGIFLSFSKVHTGNFEYLLDDLSDGTNLSDLVFEEKAKLIRSLKKGDYVVLNFDDKKIIKLQEEISAKVITFGLEDGADVRGDILEVTKDGFKGEVIIKNQRVRIKVIDCFINKQMFKTLLAAICVGLIFNIDLKDCIKEVEKIKLPPGRMNKIEGIKDTLIIDSSYNASKLSMFEALDNLSLYKKRRKVAILGDMRELGREAKSEHEEIAHKAAKIADEMVLIGPSMREYFIPEVIRKSFDSSKLHHFENPWEALKFIKEDLIKGEEVVLIKGSQNTLFLEIIVEGLMKDKSKADELLCRRGEFWSKKRMELIS